MNESTGRRRFPGAATPVGSDDEADGDPEEQDEADLPEDEPEEELADE